MIQNEEVESLERRLSAVRKAVEAAPDARQALADVEAELEAIRSVEDEGNKFLTGLHRMTHRPNVITNGVQSVTVISAVLADLENKVLDLERRQRELSDKIAGTDIAAALIAEIEKAIESRKKQIKFLHGGVLGLIGLGQPFGSDPRTAIAGDVDFIRSQIEAKAGTLVTRRERAEAEAGARWHQAVEDLAKWAESNEVTHAGVREVRVGFSNVGSRECCVVYRCILHIDGARQFWKIDRHAKLLFLPFSHHQVGQHLANAAGVQVVGAVLAPGHAAIGEDGKLIHVVDKVPDDGISE